MKRNTASYRHRIVPLSDGTYRVSYVVDKYYAGHRLRYPQARDRVTDLAGALRFAKRWNVPVPGGGGGGKA